MPKTATTDELRKGNKVVAAADLRDVPAGTAGRVILVNGMTWIRYWVRFDNGVYLGSIPRASLATPAIWNRHLAGEDVLGATGASGADAGDSAEAGGDEGDGGGKTTPAG